MIRKRILFSLFAVLLLSSTSFSQGETKIGISGSVQANQLGILLPVRINERVVVAPAFDFKFAETVGVDFSVGLVPRFYLNDEKLAPYFGLKFGAMINIPSSDNVIDDETKVDFLGGLAFGAEYFLSESFSFGVEAQGNVTKSAENSYRFGNPGGINFNTATMISATIYF